MTATNDGSNIFVVGLPRSGSTWVSKVLGLTSGAYWLKEPDNEVNDPFAARAKRSLGRYPVLAPGDPAPADFERLWAGAFEDRYPVTPLPRLARRTRLRAARRVLKGFPRTKPRTPYPSYEVELTLRYRLAGTLSTPRVPPRWATSVVVKSVLAAMAAEWIYGRWHPRVAVVVRHPFNVVASWLELKYPVTNLAANPLVTERHLAPLSIPSLEANASRLSRTAWEIAALTCILQDAAARHPEWHMVVHDDLCLDPRTRLRGLADDLGLEWSARADRYLESSDGAGQGYKTQRIASEQPGRWRTRLSQEQIGEIQSVLEGFPPSLLDLVDSS
jgi:hypothetical protein